MEDTLTNSIPKDKKTSDEKTLSNKEDLDKIQSNENSTNDDIESLNGDQNISRFQKDGHNVSKKDHILSIINAVVNYINTLVGAGIIALPITFALAGIVFSILISLVCALLIFYTADLMIKVSLKLKKTRNIQINSYSELAKATIGSWSQHLVTILILLLMFFLMSIYAIILRKSVKSLIEDFTGKVFRYDKLVLLAIIAPVFLLCVQRNIKNLGYTSSLSACLVVFFMIVIIIRSPYYNKLVFFLNLDE
ncbi:hypothetical protein MHBO_001054 [Bonamia ostreae]|uniref:Amino acid transporter transmembrane domain-containing protein n=1 Tax=Bonamia ostreae TaxID=126728 RepID=A0ABV2AHN3_9EUKA